MRGLWVATVAAVGFALLCSSIATPAAHAQNQPNPDEINRKYEDALNQLKAAQDRKNELANENEQLKARIAELEKQIQDAKRVEAEQAERTFRLRSHYAAWNNFIKRYPHLAERWRVFLDADLLAVPSQVMEPPEPEWVLRPPAAIDPRGGTPPARVAGESRGGADVTAQPRPSQTSEAK